MIKTQPLATDEGERLARCERVIERGFTVFVEVGQALAEIRDAKLYRGSHKTFEEYCKARWEIGRSRAYELIDQAKVSAALTEAGVNLSATADISKRDVRALKEDLPAAAAEIKTRVDQGEKVDEATKAVAAARQTEAVAQQAEHDRQREEHRAALPAFVEEREQAKAEAIATRKAAPADDGLTPEDRIAELEEAVRVLEAEAADLRAENKLYGAMKAQFQQGGFDKVVAGKDEEIRVLQTRVEAESRDKAIWAGKAKYWQAEAKKLGWTNGDFTIDLETGEIADA